mmetsp:Transcript_12536/g.22748  ORF Transcript_12536/g.22748 Transcript_12536/m.22748 type:complete len:134 (-) Transcript_12536:152-553(-)
MKIESKETMNGFISILQIILTTRSKKAAFGSQERSDRRVSRQVLREQEIASKEQQRKHNIAKRQKKEYDDLTLQKYDELLNDRDHRSKMAEAAKKDAEKQLRELKEELAAKDNMLKKAKRNLSYLTTTHHRQV